MIKVNKSSGNSLKNWRSFSQKKVSGLATSCANPMYNSKKMKMKVNLAVQLLSASVANAIQFCNKDLQLPQFQGSEATVSFLRLLDRLFDFCNSTNPFGHGCKAALKPENEDYWHPFTGKASVYIKKLSNASHCT